MKKYRAVKYDGDDCYSWAIFKAKDIKGLRSPISGFTKIRPLMTGMDMHEARREVNKLEKKWKEKK